jgi:hypothetical protein
MCVPLTFIPRDRLPVDAINGRVIAVPSLAERPVSIQGGGSAGRAPTD